LRSTFWLATSAAALPLILVAVLGLRGTAPPASAILDPPRTTQAAHAAPAAPAPARTALDQPPSFDIVNIDPTGQAVIAGRAAPGARVRVLDGDTPIGDATADARGEWVVVTNAPLAPGERQLVVEATSRVTGVTRRSDDVVALSVAPADRKGVSLAVLLPGGVDQAPRILQRAEATAAAGGLSLDAAEFDASGRLLLSGHAEPGARLNLYAGNQLLGTAAADATGKWSAVAPHPQSSGALELRIDQMASDGSVAHRVAQAFAPPPLSTEGGRYRYLVKHGNNLWWIARQVYGEGVRYTAIYGANRDHIRDPNLIYPGQLFKLPKS
jgi:nucleoid-associated protein YgaU